MPSAATISLFQNNYVGVNGTGAGEIPDTTRGLSALGNDAEILDNLFGGSSVLVGGNNTTVQGNVFGIGPNDEDVGIGGGDSLEVSGVGVIVGGTAAGDGNVLGNSDGASNSAISIEADSALLRGNRIGVQLDGEDQPNEGNGITVGPSGVADNVIIGGTGAGAPNVISNSGADAIRVPFATTTNTVIRGNTGRDNGLDAADLFIDLGLDGPGNATTNEAIQPPTVTSVTATEIQGTSTEPVATAIDVYRTITARGDVHSYLGTAGVSGGTWSFTYPAPLRSRGLRHSRPQRGPGHEWHLGAGADNDDRRWPLRRHRADGEHRLRADRPHQRPEPHLRAELERARRQLRMRHRRERLPGLPRLLHDPVADRDGTHTLDVRATDPAGNVGTPVSRSFEIDTADPETTATFAKKRRLRRIMATFSSEPGADFLCRLNRQAVRPLHLAEDLPPPEARPQAHRSGRGCRRGGQHRREPGDRQDQDPAPPLSRRLSQGWAGRASGRCR